MQVESLEVQRRPSYDSDYPNQLVGLVKLKSNLGSQEIRVSNKGLAKIFEVIAEEVSLTAQENASRTKGALADAMHEPLLNAAQKVEQLS